MYVQMSNYLATSISCNMCYGEFVLVSHQPCDERHSTGEMMSLAAQSLLELEGSSLVSIRALGRQTLVGSLLEPSVRTDARVCTKKYER